MSLPHDTQHPPLPGELGARPVPARPVFVIGAESSGVELLSWGLGQHPNLRHVPETGWLNTLARDLDSMYQSDAYSSDLAAMSVSRSRFYEGFGHTVNDLMLSGDREHAGGSITRWVGGAPDHGVHIAGLLRLFPRAQFIHVIRDADAVVRALVGQAGQTATGDADPVYGHWLTITKAIVEAETLLGSHTIARVRYSDLFQRPETSIRRCLDFLGEYFHRNCLRPFPDGRVSSVAPDGPCDTGTTSPLRCEAELMSRLVLQDAFPDYPGDSQGAARLDAAFSASSGRLTLPTRGPAVTAAPDKPGRFQRRVDSNKKLAQRIRSAATMVLPADATVLVIAKGDDALISLPGLRASHFPQDTGGGYSGFHPADSADAITRLQALRGQGHDFLLIPAPFFWWLDFYKAFADHLHATYDVVYSDETTCSIFGPVTPGTRHRTPLSTDVSSPTSETNPQERRVSPGAPVSPVSPLARAVWDGFSTQATADLETILADSSRHRDHRTAAALELARWHASHRHAQEVLRLLRSITDLDPSKRLSELNLLLEVFAHLGCGSLSDAYALIASAVSHYGYDSNLCLLSANALFCEAQATATPHSADDERLEALNRIYRRHNLQSIRKRNPHGPLAIDNLVSCPTRHEAAANGPRVSVIMPAHNAADTIAFALASLQEQTWRNLEILVVDDHSSDETRAIVSRIAANDTRITLLCLDENSGAYVARNTALNIARGEYITVNDADDWSHPQKIETQVGCLLNGEARVSLTYLVRVSWHLWVNVPWYPTDRLVRLNYSSLMIETALARSLGGWDPVWAGADSEFLGRVRTAFDKASVLALMDAVPLSLSLETEGSLTQSSATHIRSTRFGARQEYSRALARWHAAASVTGSLSMHPDPHAGRPFPAPAPLISPKGAVRDYDVVVVCDLASDDEAFVHAYDSMLAALHTGLRVAVFHWPLYHRDPDRDLNESVAILIDRGTVDIVVVGQKVTTRYVVAFGLASLHHTLDRMPDISAGRLHVIVTHEGEPHTGRTRGPQNPAIVRHNLQSLFGSTGTWWPASPMVRTLASADLRCPALSPETWLPLIDTETRCHSEIRWRGRDRRAPLVGYRGSNQGTGGPQSGDTRPAMDFLVCVEPEAGAEPLVRDVITAMAAGIPTLLPRQYAGTFGSAPIYCEPGDVAARIQELWLDEARYLELARAGREFVRLTCSLGQFARRLRVGDSPRGVG